MLILIGGIGFIFVNRPELLRAFLNNQTTNNAVKIASGAVKGAATSLNIDTDKILNTATSKLVEKQLLDEDGSPQLDQPGMGSAVQNLTDQVVSEVKDLPKNQAKIVINKVCQQMIDNLDKGE